MATTVAAAAVAAAAVSPAAAQTGSVDTGIGGAPAAIDITSLWAGNSRPEVQMKMFVDTLTERGKFYFYWTRNHRGMAVVVTRRHHRTHADVFQLTSLEHSHRVACAGLYVGYNKQEGAISVEAPQSCYPGRIPARWSMEVWAELGDEHDLGNPPGSLVLRRSGRPSLE